MKRYYLQEPTHTKGEKLYLAAPTYLVKADVSTGIVDAFVSVMGNIDLQDDIIHMGAFTKTIQETTASGFRVLDNHNWFSIMDTLGVCLAIEERPRRDLPKAIQDKFPDAQGGLWTSTQFMMDDEKSRGAFNRIKSGAITQYSIGFQIIKSDFGDVNLGTIDEPVMMQVQNIREIRLFEYSPVIFAANVATATESAKNAKNFGSIPITIDNLVAKRAESTKSCANCKLFKGFAGDIGFCNKHQETTKSNLICADYASEKGDIRTLSDEFESEYTDFLTDFMTNHAPDSEYQSLIPTIVTASSRMLPDSISQLPVESPDTDSNKPISTSDENEEVANEQSLTESKRKALIEEIQRNQEIIRQKRQG